MIKLIRALGGGVKLREDRQKGSQGVNGSIIHNNMARAKTERINSVTVGCFYCVARRYLQLLTRWESPQGHVPNEPIF